MSVSSKQVMGECVWCVYGNRVPLCDLVHIKDEGSADRDEGLACKKHREEIEIGNMKNELINTINSTSMSKDQLRSLMAQLSLIK